MIASNLPKKECGKAEIPRPAPHGFSGVNGPVPIVKDMDKIWSKAMAAIQEKVSPQVFNMWLKPLRPGSAVDEAHLEILAANDFSMEFVRKHYGTLLETALADEAGHVLKVTFKVDPAAKTFDPKRVPPPEPVPAPVPDKTGLDPRYTFDSFVVGSCNQFAHAASARVADEPFQVYNPLFVYGGVGLGKTHLLHAIGNQLVTTRPELRILYISSEKFMTQLINSLRFSRVHDFKDNFRSVDVLLVDDIQFIAGKKATQEEFFHTFNALFDARKQIILSSDSFPAEIEHLEERLRSRFSWGLVADIHPPDLETRVAILKKKAVAEGMDLQDDVAFFLADAIQSNVRELEGALIRVFAMASMNKEPVTMALVRDSIRRIVKPVEKQQTSIEEIQNTVAAYYKIRATELRSDKRSRTFSHPRQVAMYLCKLLTNNSYPIIGERFGGRDHTTVLYAVSRINEKQAKDSVLAKELHSLSEMLRK